MRGVIRLNDPTGHGGHVIEAAQGSWVMGIRVARYGDKCSCPHPGHDGCTIDETRMGRSSEQFDQGFDSPADYRNRSRQRDGSDPLASGKGMPQGDATSEAALQYDLHASVRMQAKRDGLYASDAPVVMEDKPEEATDDYRKWRKKQVTATLAENIDTHATDHSTIVANAMHAEKALAYDVAIGVCNISAEDIRQLRIIADWRLLDGLNEDNDHGLYLEYFLRGTLDGIYVDQWANAKSGRCKIPEVIIDERDGAAYLKMGRSI